MIMCVLKRTLMSSIQLLGGAGMAHDEYRTPRGGYRGGACAFGEKKREGGWLCCWDWKESKVMKELDSGDERRDEVVEISESGALALENRSHSG